MSDVSDVQCGKYKTLQSIYEIDCRVPFISRSGYFSLPSLTISVARLSIATPGYVFTLCNLSVTVDNQQFLRVVVKYNDDTIYAKCSSTTVLWNPGREKGPKFRSPSYLYIETYNYDASDRHYWVHVDLWKERS